MEVKEFCLIVAHDAGGAEILVNYVVQKKVPCIFALDGPAIKIFLRKIPGLSICSLEQGIQQASWVLCGTSWQSDLEWRAIKLAKKRQLKVVTFLDHWVNYQERFVRNGIRQLPDQIWVGDTDAEKVAQSCFPDLPIRVEDNPYLLGIKKQLASLQYLVKKEENKTVVLFVSENISGHALLKYGDKDYFGYTEFGALDFLLENLCLVSDKPIDKLIIRPHPSDEKGKYSVYQKKFPELITVSENSTLLKDISLADIVAGCESMALVVALVAEKYAVSCIPGQQEVRLPHSKIHRLKNML